MVIVTLSNVDVLSVPAATLQTTRPVTALLPIDRVVEPIVVCHRAAQRGMKPSTYVAALVRAHIAVNPPLTTDELAAFKDLDGAYGLVVRKLEEKDATAAAE